MYIIIQTIMPLILIGVLGYGAIYYKIFTIDNARFLNNFLFYVACPALLFRLSATMDINYIITALPYIAIYYMVAISLFFGNQVVARYIFKRTGAALSIFAMGTVFGNSLNIGLASMLLLLDEQHIYPFIILISVHGLILLTCCALTTELYSKYNANHTMAFIPYIALIIWNTIRHNAIILAAISGFIWNILEIPWFTIVENMLQPLGATAVPLSLFAIGMFMKTYTLKGQIIQSSYITIVKIILFPAIIYGIFHYILQASPLWVFCATYTAALPCGNNVIIFANMYNTAIRIASSSIFLSTILCIITLSLIIYWLHPYV